MSSQAQPINPADFAIAIEELPIEQIYGKAAELHNQIFHLQKSNEQLKEFADDGDEDCAQALRENEEVVARVNLRLRLLRLEVERRGMVWSEHGENRAAEVQPPQATARDEAAAAAAAAAAASESDVTLTNGVESRDARIISNGNDAGNHGPPGAGRGRLNDEQLAALMRARMAEELEDEDGNGIDL